MKILIILGHPAKKRQSLSEALANAYKEGAIESGHEVRLYKVADKQFDPILHEGYWEEQAAEPDIIEAQERIRWADHLVFVYPLWEYMIPRRPASINHGPQWIAEGSDQELVVTGPSAGPSPARSERAVRVTAPLSWSGTRHEYAQVPPQPNLNRPSSTRLSRCRITNCGGAFSL